MKNKFIKIKLISQKSGFTFIETLIYLAIVGLVVVGLVSFALSISGTQNKNYAVQEAQVNARIAIDIISQRIKASSGVNIGASVFGSDPGVLSLSMADAGKNPTIINLNQDDGTLQITEGASAPVALTSNKVKVTNLVFTNLGHVNKRRNIGVDITVAYNADNSDIYFNYSESLHTAVSIRK
ncbi:MAG: prepilin-type N-terminal cleavage/methylation domain-containing protein [Patescibacteria group bacterium]|nr:prepilin-type N-terminal cleavage/methylation domain-containing protein [Patescibacteria group bacterium]MDD4610996.1 prepilin-type N-terminal cleavage/methylation domain-containing protein [Patescibacteria group bacterium]